MMIKRKIQWIPSIDEKENTEPERSDRVFAALGTAGLSLVYALIFVCATIITVTDIYEYNRPSVVWFIEFVLLIFGAAVAIDYADKSKNRFAKLVPFGVLGIGILYLSSNFWGLQRAENLTGGIIAFIRIYIGDWNTKYGTGIRWYMGKDAFIEDGAFFLIFAGFFLLFWFAKFVKKEGLMMIAPIGIILVEFMVGEAPGRWPFFLLIIGILLHGSRAWERPDMQSTSWKRRDDGAKGHFFLWLGSSLVMSIICGVILIGGVDIAQNLIDRNAAKVTTDVAKITEHLPSIKDLSEISAPEQLIALLEQMFKGEQLDYKELTNNTPDFRQEIVLEVALGSRPSENLYLKDFCGDIYENGMWERGNERLEAAADNVGVSYDELKSNVTYLTVNKLTQQYGADSFVETGMTREVSITYVNLSTDKVYTPYFSILNTDGISLESDGYFAKQESLNTVSFIQWNEENFDFTDIAGSKGQWEKDYEKFVTRYYMDVPANLTIVKEIASEIAKPLSEETMSIGVELNNDMRMLKANLVAAWLKENTEYSLELPAIPNGEDPIAYFLETSRRGYCMHYASGAVMIMRELGVPARYVSGYIVPANDFMTSESGYQASVLDERAHAWVEIYLTEIGWVPVEVTKGYPSIKTTEELLANMPILENITGEIAGTIEVVTGTSGAKDDEQDGQSGNSGIIVSSENIEDSEDNEISENSETSGKENLESSETVYIPGVTDDSGNDADKVTDVSNDTSDVGAEDTSESRFVMIEAEPEDAHQESKVSLMVVVYVMIAIAAIIGIIALTANTHKFFRSETIYYRKLKKQINSGNHKNAILDINSAIYRKLEFKKLLEPGSGDEKYESVLKKNYKDYSDEEWEKYMDIVKAANFSEREFTKEELKFVYDVYRDVIYKDEVW